MGNRVLSRRAMQHSRDGRRGRRDMRGMRGGMDGRNSYDSRKGYADSRDYRRADTPAGGMYGRGMGRGSYYPESSDMDYRGYDRYSGYSDGYYGGERYRQPGRMDSNDMHMMDYNDYNDYNDYRDYNYDSYDRDYAKEDEEYKKDLHEWINKMKNKDRFGWSKEQVINSAKQMNVNFGEFDENEFYAIYLAMVTDYKSLGNEPRIYLTLAKEWLNDDDTALRGSEKVCAYLYGIVLDK
jgi:hypothetical protein